MKKNVLYSFTHWVSYATIAHGIIYYFVKYFMALETEYGIRPHFLQSYIQGVHIVLSPLLIFAFGLLFKDHIIKMFKNAIYKRKTGITLSATMVIMIFSGYLVQVIYQAQAKIIIAYVHIGISLVFTVAYLIHHLFKR